MNLQNKIERIAAWKDNGMVYMEGLAILRLFPERLGLYSKLRAEAPNKSNRKRLERALTKIHFNLRIESRCNPTKKHAQ